MQLNISPGIFFRNQKIKNLLISLFALSFIWPLQFLSQIYQPESVDASWMIALARAWERNSIFGQDIIFTYGPLSFLSTRVILNESIKPLILFDVFFAVSFVYIIYKILEEKRTTIRVILILTTCFLFKHAMFLSLVFTLQFLVILYLIRFKKSGNKWLLVHAMITTTLIFYIKFNLTFVSIGVFILFIAHMYSGKYISVRYVIATIALLFTSIFLSSLILPVNLFDYVNSGLELINSYNDAVYVYPSTLLNQILALIILSAFVLTVITVGTVVWRKSVAEKVMSLLFIALAFVIFKQSYVRADIEHIKDFFYVMPVLLVLYLYASGSKPKPIYGLLLILWGTGLFINFYIYKDYYYPIKKIAAFPLYFKTMNNGFDYYSQTVGLELPENIKSEIGTASVDIIPWEASVLILNKLNYNPRPVIQSYQAYNQTLDQINADKYLSADAPEYVIYGINSIDKHYHFFDDTYLKKELSIRYYDINSFMYKNERLILFKRSNIREQKEFSKVASGKMNIHDSLIVRQSNYPLMIKIKMHHSFIGQIQKTVLRAPHSEIELRLEDSSVCFQAATSILEGGVFIDRYIDNAKGAAAYFSGDSSGRKIRQIKMHVDNYISWDTELEYEWYELR